MGLNTFFPHDSEMRPAKTLAAGFKAALDELGNTKVRH